MSQSRPPELPPGSGVFYGLSQRIRLIARLVTDRRVNPLVKLLPAAALAYALIPDLLLGPVDDAALLWVGTYLFVELCPPEVVEEHMRRLRGEWSEPPPGSSANTRDDDVIDAEFRDLND